MDRERNIFTGALGIEAYRRWRDPLCVDRSPFGFLIRVDWVRGVVGGLGQFSAPLMDRFRAENSSSLRRLAFSGVFDLASIAALYFVGTHVDVLVGGAVKLAYNLSAEAGGDFRDIVDAWRAKRRGFIPPSQHSGLNN